MQNYCSNKITLSGDAKDVRKALSFMKGPNGSLDFKSIIPYPKVYAEKDDEYEKIGYDAYKKKYGHTNTGYNTGGYEWCLSNWGTKWNAIDPYHDKKNNTIEFDTAWSPPNPIIAKIHESNPNVGIKFTYNEPGMCFAGIDVFKSAKGNPDIIPGEPIVSAYWEGTDYQELYPESRLTTVFEEALYAPEKAEGYREHSELTDEEVDAVEEDLERLIEELVTHPEPVTEESLVEKLKPIAEKHKVVINTSFENTVSEMVKEKGEAMRKVKLEKAEKAIQTMTEPKATQAMAELPSRVKEAPTGESKTTDKKAIYKSLDETKEQARQVIRDLVQQQQNMTEVEKELLEETNVDGLGALSTMGLIAQLHPKDHEAFLDFLASEDFQEILTEDCPTIADMTAEQFKSQLEAYRKRRPYNEIGGYNFVWFMNASKKLGKYVGVRDITTAELYNAIKDWKLTNTGSLALTMDGQLTYLVESREKIRNPTRIISTAKDINSYSLWYDLKNFIKSGGVLPSDILEFMHVMMLRSVLGMGSSTDFTQLKYSPKHLSLATTVSFSDKGYTYQDLCTLWTDYLEAYEFLRFAIQKAGVRTGMVQNEGLAEFLRTGNLNYSIVEHLETVERLAYDYYITARIFAAIKEQFPELK